MKLAVSLPDSIFTELDRRARSASTSRSALVAQALRAWFERHPTSVEPDAAAAAWHEWVLHGPQGPIEDEGEADFP